MCLLNARSLKKVNSSNSKACELLSKDLAKYNVDVCVVIETFLTKRIPDTYVWIDGFSVFRRDRDICNCRKSHCSNLHRGGGILLYSRSNIHGECHSVSSDTESMWIKFEITNSNPIFVNASYAPPSAPASYVNNLRKYITEKSHEIQTANPKATIYIAGDFNRMDLDDAELPCGVSSLLSPPTRGDAILEIVLTNKPHLIETVTCFTSLVESDHKAVLVAPNKTCKPERVSHSFRLYNSVGHKRIQSLFSDGNFAEEVYDCGSHVDQATETLERAIYRGFIESFPLRRIHLSNKDPGWITPKVKWLLAKKKNAKRKGNYRQGRRIDEQIRAAKLRLFSAHETKQWWNEMDSITHRKHDKKSMNYRAFDPELLNHQLAKRSGMSENEIRKSPPHIDSSHCSTTPLLSLSEVCHILSTCKRTSPGMNGIPSFVYQKYSTFLAPHYLHVWNLSLKSGIFPACYKRADIIPLPKVKTPKNVKDVRGISVTSIAARLFEKLVHRQWISKNILSRGDTLQFAYKQGLSTIDYLVCLQHFILSRLDKCSVDGVHVVAVDFSMAFDRVDQEIAASSYAKFVDSKLIQKWLYNFTMDRMQRLVWRDKACDYITIDRGCSQGTVGGPNIFSMLTDDIQALNQSCAVFKYSDDMCCATPCLCRPSDTEKTMFHREMKHFYQVTTKKSLTVNIEKTKQIRFCLNNVPICECVPLPSPCSTVSEVKILGLLFQENCSFKRHCKNLLSHLRSLLFLFKDLKLKRVPSFEIHQFFNAIIVSRIRYGISVYGSDAGATKTIDDFLEKCHYKGYSENRIFVNDILRAEDERLFYNILSNPQHPLRDYLTSHYKDRTTRHGFKTLKPITRTKAFANSFCNRVL